MVWKIITLKRLHVVITVIGYLGMAAQSSAAIGELQGGNTNKVELQAKASPGPSEHPSRATLEKLERKFKESMSGAVLEGFWQMTGEGGLSSVKPLTEPKPEKYFITDVAKVTGDDWVITARIVFGNKDVQIPVAVKVVWAGDTPIITIDDFPVPMIGTYSARVTIYRGFYSGVWLSNEKNYGGVMAGRVVKQPKAGKVDN